MKKENKMYLLIIICAIVVYLLLRKPSASGDNSTIDKANARTVGGVSDWPVTTTPSPVIDPDPETFLIYAYSNLSENGIDLYIESGPSVGWIDFNVLRQSDFTGIGYPGSVVLGTDMTVRTGENAIYRFNFPSPLDQGDYVVVAKPQRIEGAYSYVYISIVADHSEPIITTDLPAWLTKIDITRLNATNETSVWVIPSGIEMRVSNKAATPQPTGKDHAGQNWDNTTWQPGTSQYAGDHNRVYRLNPPTIGVNGIESEETYYFDFRRSAYPNTIFRVEYTVPDTDLMFVSLLPGIVPPVDPGHDPEELDQLPAVEYIQSPDGIRKLEILGSRRVKLAISNTGVITDTYHEDIEAGGRRTAEMFPGLYNVYYVIGTDIYDLLSEITLPKGLFYIDKIYARASLFPTKESVVSNIIGLTPENDDVFDVANIILKVV